MSRTFKRDCTGADDMDNLELDMDDDNVAMSKMK